MNEQHISLDVSKAPNVTQVVRIGQGDKGGTTIVASIYDNGIAMSMAGMTAKFCMRTPGNGYVEDESVTVSGSTLTYVVDEEHCASTAGYTDECYFQILQGTTIIASTSRFAMHVLRSVSDGTEPSRAWTNGIEEWLEDASDELNGFVANANARVGATINAANAAVEQVCADAQSTVADAAETLATAAERVDAAIEAVEDISELAVPEMSPDVRGGAKLDADGGLALRDGALGVGSLVQESSGQVRGGIASLTAKGHAEQQSTTGKNLLPNTATSQTINGVTFTVNADGSVTCNGTASALAPLSYQSSTLSSGTYTLSGCPSSGGDTSYRLDLRTSPSIVVTGGIDSGDGATFSLESDTGCSAYIRIASGYTCNNLTFHPQLEAGSTATEYEPYTGAAPSPSPEFPQEIRVVRGRNLANVDPSSLYYSSHPLTVTCPNRNSIHLYSSTANSAFRIAIPVEIGKGYTLTADFSFTESNYSNVGLMENGSYDVDATRNFITGCVHVRKTGETSYSPIWTFTANTNTVYIGSYVAWRANSHFDIDNLQLTEGPMSQPYVPYGHVGMEARDPDTDELISCTALPLPSRGWVGSLPDGTADVLRLDGAGKVEWELLVNDNTINENTPMLSKNIDASKCRASFMISPDQQPTTDASHIDTKVLSNYFLPIGNSESMAGIAGIHRRSNNSTNEMMLSWNQGRFTEQVEIQTWLSTHNVTVLYPLATPVTEDCGYVDMPSIPGDAHVSIPELDALGVSYFVDDAVVEYGRQIYERVRGEYAGRITALEQAVAELATA